MVTAPVMCLELFEDVPDTVLTVVSQIPKRWAICLFRQSSRISLKTDISQRERTPIAFTAVANLPRCIRPTTAKKQFPIERSEIKIATELIDLAA
jgi:hypothetical protein